ncbi:MAG: class D sortase [Lachnospiraceae bacterium]
MRRRRDEINYYRRLAGHLLIAAGLLLIIAVAVINAADFVRSRSAIAEFNEAKRHTITMKEDLDDERISESPISLNPVEAEAEVDLTAVLGVLRIPKIELEEAIREGSAAGVISSALGHLEDTALPGQQGNCAIAGHRNYVFGRFFNRLNEIAPGDTIEIETLEAAYHYTVTESFIVEPEDTSVLEQMDGQNLTLITCTPLFIGSHRLIIRAVRDGD